MSEAALGARALDWLLRRVGQTNPIASDVVLVLDHPALDDCPPRLAHAGRDWCFARVRGELALRDALIGKGAAPIVLAVPSVLSLPNDVRARAHLHRVVELRAEDVVAGLAGRPCAPLGDEALEEAVLSLLAPLGQRARRWTFGRVVQPADVRALVLACVFASEQRLDREDPGELLARWLVEPPLLPKSGALLRQALVDAHGQVGDWLGWGLVAGRLPELLVGGALATGPAGRRALPQAVAAEAHRLAGPAGETEVFGALALLARGAAVALAAAAPERLREVLAPAEAAFHALRGDGRDYPLIEGALRVELAALGACARDGRPADDFEVARLSRSVHAARLEPAIEFVRDLGRLARYVAMKDTETPTTLAAWADFALRHVAWADRAARDVRRRLPVLDGHLLDEGRALLAKYLDRRDAQNAAFARALVAQWSRAAFERAPDRPLAVHQVVGSIVAPLMDLVDRVFWVVLDGCDLSTFAELAASLPPELGLALPNVAGNAFAGRLREARAYRPAFSVPPTVTTHARRALFAGELPGNPVLDEHEAAAATALRDQDAFAQCRPLQGVARRLFLKGDLRDGGAALAAALRARTEQVIAAVFNGVDDALASHETTALPPWRAEALGEGFLDALKTAVECGWVVLVTADHGHTPFWSMERKRSGAHAGERFRRTGEADEHAVVLAGDAAPGGPYALLHAVGAFYGPQRRGFHGGVGLEEMVVPLAFVGRVPAGTGRPVAPGWWAAQDADDGIGQPGGVSLTPARVGAPPGPAVGVGSALPDELRARFRDDARALALLDALALHERLTPPRLVAAAGVELSEADLRAYMAVTAMQARRAGLGELFAIEGGGPAETYRWTGRRRG